MKKVVCFLLTGFVALSTLLTNVCYAAPNTLHENELYAKSAVLMDGDSGRILFSKNGEEAMANASTTKILTCIVALESEKTEEIVTVSNRAASAPKVHLGMKAEQRFYIKDLLYGLMLESFNDCAIAIAEHIGGSVEAFAELMNEKAKEIGCKDSYFITPNGLDATDEKGFHHTTAADLARIMRYCILESVKSEEFRVITGTKNYQFCEIDSGRSYSCFNHNAFLDMMQGAFSGKTGFTGAAGYCYVGALTKEGKTYIVALLACGWPNNKNYKWSDSKKLMQYGMNHFEKVNLKNIKFDREKLRDIHVKNGQSDKIGEAAYVGLRIGEGSGTAEVLMSLTEEVRIVYQINRNLEAPVAENTVVGGIRIICEDDLFWEYSVYTTETVLPINYSWCIKQIFFIFIEGVNIDKINCEL